MLTFWYVLIDYDDFSPEPKIFRIDKYSELKSVEINGVQDLLNGLGENWFQVHRLLLAAVGTESSEKENSEKLLGNKGLQELAEHINTKHRVSSSGTIVG